MMKPFLFFLFLLLSALPFFHTHAVVWKDKEGNIHSTGQVPINKKFQEDFEQKAHQPIDQIFYGDQHSNGTTIAVTLHQKIEIVLTLPDDEKNGELTHQYKLLGSPSAESSLQYLACNDRITQEDGSTLNLGEFYLTGGIHPLAVQHGVKMSFCVVANKVSEEGTSFPLTFRIDDGFFTRDLFPNQYRFNQPGSSKTITWNVVVKEGAPAASEASRAQ